ncbi:MAG: hypothetical protein R3Y53_11520 [Bacillota bacterium]
MKKLNKKEREVIAVVKETLLCESLMRLPDSLYEEIVRLLHFFRYSISEKDIFFLSMSLMKVHQRICDFCNTEVLQAEMYRKFVVAVVGEFLFGVYHTRKLSTEEMESTFLFEEVVTSLQEGDVKVSFDAKESFAVRFFQLLQEMRSVERQFLQYRKLRW